MIRLRLLVVGCLLALLSDRAGADPGAPASGLSSPTAGLSTLFFGLIFLIALPIIIFAGLQIMKSVKAKRQQGIIDEMLREAKKCEGEGQFVSAGRIYEELKEVEKAAALYAKGGDFGRAAMLYESLGLLDKTREMYERGGEPAKAAQVCLAMRDFLSAAKIYDGIGEKKKAGRAFEKAGNRLAAVRAYRESKEYQRAAVLLGEEGLFRESADMFKLSLAEKLNRTNAGDYAYYASLLEKAGDDEDATALYQQLFSLFPGDGNIRQRLESLTMKTGVPSPSVAPSPRSAPQAEFSVQRESVALRNFISSGKMDPRHALKLWVQILRALRKEHEKSALVPNLSPDSILVGRDNSILFDREAPKSFAYTPPELMKGGERDSVSEIYSMGLILYEMLTGSLDSFGLKTPAEVAREIPQWLEGLTMKCIAKERPERFQNVEEIFLALKTLKSPT